MDDLFSVPLGIQDWEYPQFPLAESKRMGNEH